MKDARKFDTIDTAAIELEARRLRAQALANGFFSLRGLFSGKRH